MHQRFVLLKSLVLTLIISLLPWAARAGGIEVTPEVWIGGGVSWPVYHAHSEACGRGGFGAVFAQHVTLGISGQADRDHFHYFVDGGVILPQVWFLVPYGRYQFGRRDDRDDNAWGWCAGMRLLGEGINFYVEASEILEPEYNKALSLGIQF
ncbi:MAG TPA: hypothetical protein VFH33_03950 [Candidatus Krumholzibacteria bacterium]|nr:hypothetical protein [Candidatus Krumholzibacteria bacterium]